MKSNRQKQPPRGILKKSCSENIQQICRRTPMPKCDFNKVPKQLFQSNSSEQKTRQVVGCKKNLKF